MTTAEATLKKINPLTAKVRELRELVGDHITALERANKLETRILIITREVVDMMLAQKKQEMSSVFKTLGDTLHCSWLTISGWYYRGRFMMEHKLDESVSARAVFEVSQMGFHSLAKPDKLKAIQMLKDGKPAKEIRGFMNRVRPAGRTLDRRMKELERDKRLTKKELRMQMMAIATLAKRVLNRDNVHVCITDENYVPLVEL